MAQALYKYTKKYDRYMKSDFNWKDITAAISGSRMASATKRQVMGGIASAMRFYQDPTAAARRMVGREANTAEHQILHRLLDESHKQGGASPGAIIPGSSMAYGKRRNYSRARGARAYSRPARRSYGKRTYGPRRSYGKKAYKKKGTSPTLSLILQGMKYAGR